MIHFRSNFRCYAATLIRRTQSGLRLSTLAFCLSRQVHQLQQHGLAGIDQFLQRDAWALALHRCIARQRRHMHEGGEAGTLLAAGGLDRAPAQVVAEIAAGVARGPCVDAGGTCRAQQSCCVRAELLRVGAIDDRPVARDLAVGVGEGRGDGIARVSCR